MKSITFIITIEDLFINHCQKIIYSFIVISNMLNYLKISILILAYVINVFHDLYHHEHLENNLLNQTSFIDLIIDKVIDLEYFYDEHDHFHHDYDSKIPFQHHHSCSGHTLAQWLSNPNYGNILVFHFLISEIDYDFKLCEVIIQKVFISDKQIFYDYLLSDQENLRAPPKEFIS